MNPEIDQDLRRWLEAGLIDEAQVQAILAFEANPARGSTITVTPARLRWPAILAIAFGTLLVSAGILLFVAAHWDRMSPGLRFGTVAGKVVLLHLLGAGFSRRMPKLATAFHAAGTLALGAAIFLAGQIFNLQEHWPGGILLWALGAWFGLALLRDWVQGALAALLTPFWLAGEWSEATRHGWGHEEGAMRILAVGLAGLAFAYLSARRGRDASVARKALAWIGGLGILPAQLAVVLVAEESLHRYQAAGSGLDPTLGALGWVVALAAPLALAIILRGRRAWMNAVALGWTLGQAVIPHDRILAPVWCALGCLGFVVWGLEEERSERVNLGIAGFALTVLWFYFSSLMDMLGRSLGLMGLGVLFLAGGWQLERLRRKLNARITGGAA